MLFTLFSLLVLALACFVVARIISKYRVSPIIILIPAAVICGLISGHNLTDLMILVKRGFSETAAGTGLMIIFGHLYCLLLAKTGFFDSLALAIHKLAGCRHGTLGLSVTGGLVSAPLPCEAGYTFMSRLGPAVSQKSGINPAAATLSLSAGIYITHSLLLPASGPLAACGITDASIPILLGLGLAVSVPSIFAADYFIKRRTSACSPEIPAAYDAIPAERNSSFSMMNQVIIALLPLMLMAIKALSNLGIRPLGSGKIFRIVNFAGEPVMAAIIGVSLIILIARQKKIAMEFANTTAESFKQSLLILAVTGAAGSFAAVFRVSAVMGLVPCSLPHWCGLIIPFMAAVLFKLLHGSSAIAMITACSVTSAAAYGMRLSPELVVLASGAGAMTVSHLNDPYFWIVSGLGGIPLSSNIRLFTAATLVTGLASFAVVFLLGLFL